MHPALYPTHISFIPSHPTILFLKYGNQEFDLENPRSRSGLGSILEWELELITIPISIPELELELQAMELELELQDGIEMELQISFQFHQQFLLFYVTFAISNYQ